MNTLEFSSHVADNVRRVLEDAGLTVAEAAEKTGIPRTTLVRHLNHPETSPFDVIELSQISRLVRKTVSSLTRVKTPPAPTPAGPDPAHEGSR